MSYANMDAVPTQTAGTSELLASDWNTYVRDNFDSIKFGHVVCTSSTRPTGIAEGTMIYETDTQKVFVYSGSAWVELHDLDNAGGVSDKALLSTLSHTESKSVNDQAWYGGPLTPTANTWVSSTGLMTTKSVTITVPTGKKWLCSFLVQARLWLLSAPVYNVWVGVDVSGATTISPDALPQANHARLAASSVYDTGEVNAAGQFTLNAGSNTITYVVKRDAGGFDIQNRALFVSPLYEFSA